MAARRAPARPQVERLLYMQESEIAPFAIHCAAVIPLWGAGHEGYPR